MFHGVDVRENDRGAIKMKSLNSSDSQRILEFVPSKVRPSFLSVVLVLSADVSG